MFDKLENAEVKEIVKYALDRLGLTVEDKRNSLKLFNMKGERAHDSKCVVASFIKLLSPDIRHISVTSGGVKVTYDKGQKNVYLISGKDIHNSHMDFIKAYDSTQFPELLYTPCSL